MPLRHALSVEHMTLQFQPVGQVIGWLHPPLLSLQSMKQVFDPASHDVHCVGQPLASPFTPESTGAVMHKPSEQTRPLLQSACV